MEPSQLVVLGGAILSIVAGFYKLMTQPLAGEEEEDF